MLTTFLKSLAKSPGSIFLLLGVSCFFSSQACAETLVILIPDSGYEKTLELADDEVGELVVYLQSFGDIVGGFKITLLDDDDRPVGKNISDSQGLAKFSNIPPGRFRITVERKMNDRGGVSTVSVGDMKLSKIRK